VRVVNDVHLDLGGLTDPPVLTEGEVLTGDWLARVREAVGQLYEYRYFLLVGGCTPRGAECGSRGPSLAPPQSWRATTGGIVPAPACARPGRPAAGDDRLGRLRTGHRRAT